RFAVQPAEEGIAAGGGGQQAAFAGQIAGIPGGVAAEGGQGFLDVVNHQRQGAERETQDGDGHPPEGNHAGNLSWKYHHQSQANATYHPYCQCLIPHCQAQHETPAGEPQRTALLVESEQEQHAGAEQQVLQCDGTPVEAGCEQIEGIGGQQSAAKQGGAPSGDPVQEQVEEPDAGGSGEQHGDSHGGYAGAKSLEYGAVDPGFESPQVTHEHHGEAGAAKWVGVGDGVRLEDAVGEEGFVVLNAQTGHEGAARDEK